MIDAVTGELFNIGHDRPLDVSVSLDYDALFNADSVIFREVSVINPKNI